MTSLVGLLLFLSNFFLPFPYYRPTCIPDHTLIIPLCDPSLVYTMLVKFTKTVYECVYVYLGIGDWATKSPTRSTHLRQLCDNF